MKRMFLTCLAGAALMAAFPNTGEGGHKDSLPAPGDSDRCPVCRMFVKQAPQWLAVASTKDGKTFFFDGPKDLFRFAFDTEKYLPKEKDLELKWLYVTDYYTLKLEPAATVFFITGSDVNGPMGRELVPVKGRTKAEEFVKDHRGRKILTFSEITPETIAGLK